MKSLEFDRHFSSEDECKRFLKEHRILVMIEDEPVTKPERQTVPDKDAPKVFPWVHVAIANAKSLLRDMYHVVSRELLQLYLNEFCYKLNRVTSATDL